MSGELIGEVAVRRFRDGLEREWEVRAIREHLTQRRARLLPRPELANGWLLFTCNGEQRRLAPLPPGWLIATDMQLARWCDDAAETRTSAPIHVVRDEPARTETMLQQ